MNLKMPVNKKNIIFAFLALLGAQPPQWFLNPSLDSTKLYGFGTGETPAKAKQNAIIDLASSLQSSIETSFEKRAQRLESNLTSSTLQKISIHTKITDLFNIEATKAQCEEKQCYTQIEIPRSKLLEHLEQRIKTSIKELTKPHSPFSYPYKKDILYPKILQDYALYSALGGFKLEIPDSIGEKPAFELRFQYDGEFSKSFKNVLEKAIQDRIIEFGKISTNSDWKILISISKADQSTLLNISASHNDEIIYNASVSDSKKTMTSTEFFAKRLAVQIYKKIQKWEEFSFKKE